MQDQQKNKKLYAIIASIGPVYGTNFYIIDNSGKRNGENAGKAFIVFLKGGIRFEISKSPSEYEQIVELTIDWHGIYNAQNAEDILALLPIIAKGDKLLSDAFEWNRQVEMAFSDDSSDEVV